MDTPHFETKTPALRKIKKKTPIQFSKSISINVNERRNRTNLEIKKKLMSKSTERAHKSEKNFIKINRERYNNSLLPKKKYGAPQVTLNQDVPFTFDDKRE